MSKDALSKAPRILDEAVSLDLLCEVSASSTAQPTENGGAAWFDAPLLDRCVRRFDGCQIAKTEALNMIDIANKMTRSEHRDVFVVEVQNAERNFSATFEEGECVSFSATQVLYIVVRIVFVTTWPAVATRHSSAI